MTIYSRLFSLTLLSIFLPFKLAMASYINVEIGAVKTSYNYFQLPNEQQNRINLPDDGNAISHRINGKIDLKNNSFLYLVYAPLNLNYSRNAETAFQFDNTDFTANANTEISYQFNAYRLGYFKKFQNTDKLTSWFGGMLNVREAKIKVRQGNVVDSFDNVGVFPLIGAGFEYALSQNISVVSHVDGLGFSQGYAYDANAQMQYNFQGNVIGFGYRTFGGGVDNDTLMNFARFETFYLSYGKQF